jgi:hypothetical protein
MVLIVNAGWVSISLEHCGGRVPQICCLCSKSALHCLFCAGDAKLTAKYIHILPEKGIVRSPYSWGRDLPFWGKRSTGGCLQKLAP